MAGTENQKLKLLYIREILEQQSDEQHRLTTQDILDALSLRGIQAERKSVIADIAALQQSGFLP